MLECTYDGGTEESKPPEQDRHASADRHTHTHRTLTVSASESGTFRKPHFLSDAGVEDWNKDDRRKREKKIDSEKASEEKRLRKHRAEIMRKVWIL